MINIKRTCKVNSLSSGKVEMYLCASCMACFQASRECVEKLNRHFGSGLGWAAVHIQAMDECSAYGNDYLNWLFHQNVFPRRESNSIMSGNGKGFTLEKLFRNAFTEL